MSNTTLHPEWLPQPCQTMIGTKLSESERGGALEPLIFYVQDFKYKILFTIQM